MYEQTGKRHLSNWYLLQVSIEIIISATLTSVCKLYWKFFSFFSFFSGLLPEMATSPEVFKASAVKGMSEFTTLPPIEGAQQQQQGEDGQAAAEKEHRITLTVHKRLLRHRRSKVQQEQLHRILYVFSSAAYGSSFVSTLMIATSRSPQLCFLLSTLMGCMPLSMIYNITTCLEVNPSPILKLV